jgi:hypothetical protein
VIADNTRWIRKPNTYSSLEQALSRTAQAYRRSLWDEQKSYVEIWCEKEALAGVLVEETALWDVPLMVTRGYGSITYLHDAAEIYGAIHKPVYVYYFGDHDPSGLDIARNVERRLREFSERRDLHFERVAVTRQQIVDLGLQTRPTKKTDSRAKSFRGRSVELDAIPSATLPGMVRDCIERHVDKRMLRVTEVAEESEREIMERIATNLPSIREWLQ